MLCEDARKTSIEKRRPTGAPRSYWVPLPHFWISEGTGVWERFFKREALYNEARCRPIFITIRFKARELRFRAVFC